MKVMKQLSIFLENRPGALARVAEALAGEGINILGLSVSDTVDHAVVRMVVTEPEKAVHLLGDAGVLVIENDVLFLELPNRPGAVAGVARRLADGGVNIEYAYCAGSEDQPTGALVLRAREPERAAELLS